MVDKYNLMYNYDKEFDSNGVLALGAWQYMTFGIFLFQLSMCRIFVSIIKGDIFIASIIVIFAEFFTLYFHANFKIPDLNEILNAHAAEKTQGETDEIKREIIKASYLHPFEKYARRKKALQAAR